MGRMIVSLIGACVLVASYAQAGFNGNQHVQGNQGSTNGAGNSNIGQCIAGNGQNAGQCIGENNGAANPKEKEKNDRIISLCSSPFMKKYAAICQ
ncbi:hypothetical protein [Serratia marcescens]|jgi:hypothetical protein|uniref:Uncharacterized protein n=1 Tax=Serratia marcescens TaxID=615 RepID=A0A5C7CA77_SERMA|nr:hypothetical protein [Serratia marcescens]EGT0452371.1 hypothetical protein [Serratia marcescens]MBN5251373.1 hypothetical protein [Serratia marcescens]MBN5256947.1 hypothetical protein [Serratia marcescens]MBN5352986.1 hypothetical protein [Serratia marcescens]MBS3894754.1 hypothetical protein [Serratia marcescens]